MVRHPAKDRQARLKEENNQTKKIRDEITYSVPKSLGKERGNGIEL
jgi:hypothetical protein